MGAPCPRETRQPAGVCGLLKLLVKVTSIGCCTGATPSASSAFVPCARPLYAGRVHPRAQPGTSTIGPGTSRIGCRVTVVPTACLGRRGARWAANALLRRVKDGVVGAGAGAGAGSAAAGSTSASSRSNSGSKVWATTAGSSITAAAAAVAAAAKAAAREIGAGSDPASPGMNGDVAASSAGSEGGNALLAGRVGWRRGEDWRSTPAAAARRASRGSGELGYGSTSLSSVASSSETLMGLDEGYGISEDDQKAEMAKPRPKLRFLVDLKDDVRRRAALYKSDWTDGLNRKSVPAILFLYFACLLPAVAFGGIASQVTQGTLGVIEYVVSCGVGGMAYAVLSGQPMTFIGPTGLTLAFMTALYSFTSVAGLPFLPVYSWVGLWTSGMLMALAMVGAPNLIEYATQFTDDVFNALLSVNFIFEAGRSLQRNFSPAVAGYSQAGALMSLNVALATYVGCRSTSSARESRLMNSGIREFMADFGPLMVIISMSIFCAMPSWKGLLSFLEVPSAFMLGQGRSWLVPMMSVAPAVRFASALPALLLTSLFFLDQNISSRVVNSPRHKMVKGAAYHQDMLVLGFITGALSIFGLPWQCAATVQSLNHVRQMATVKSSPPSAGSKSDEIVSIHETRATGFCVHALVLGSLALLPQLAKIPMAVVSGIFLYLGRKVMSGNAFLIRLREMITDQSLLSPGSDTKRVGYRTSLGYTGIQVAMLVLLWTLKSFKQTALFFPSVIGLLIVVRLAALPKLFSRRELDELDAAVG